MNLPDNFVLCTPKLNRSLALPGNNLTQEFIDDDTSNGYYNIEIPMTVDIDYRGKQAGLVMRHWLPLQLIKNNAIEIADGDILFFMEP